MRDNYDFENGVRGIFANRRRMTAQKEVKKLEQAIRGIPVEAIAPDITAFELSAD